jgi:outer membrane protein assembly factor BamE
MQKLLISLAVVATLSLAACSGERIPWVYRIDVQQGNVITQEQVDQLQPGMSRRQVRFIMGTPLVADVFHKDRWDYLYLMKPGRGQPLEKRLTLYFENDRLGRLEGDFRPRPLAERPEAEPQVTSVVVPPQERKPRGLLTRLWQWLFRRDDDTS